MKGFTILHFLNGCNSNYLAKQETLRSRVRVHKKQISNKEFRMLDMSQHISICGRNKTPDLFITPFYKEKRRVSISERLWKNILSKSTITQKLQNPKISKCIAEFHPEERATYVRYTVNISCR